MKQRGCLGAGLIALAVDMAVGLPLRLMGVADAGVTWLTLLGVAIFFTVLLAQWRPPGENVAGVLIVAVVYFPFTVGAIWLIIAFIRKGLGLDP